ncbi:quinone-dependent dihydroorotate dehydrogenase [Conexibacter sp. JD483]|uniref:quinone-dependent dihydroorotate dehydrogenase n=1 Tax=unclassified Conexibacter TaxID=2627773 RepID=UPI002726ADC6|nr:MULTISPECIES: quinone-dependent dihydroorotate dehydrogenase [unclassified Conexibacter]MDO8186489.1 quinone-dependent dihydroorotate dehydrogenase [Conexibacter sp. CPCC 205706]MDO8200058.1 quinone-dependent dihydroorotate dehydrogenase [Conexibacter sp. CPCC 205762]MDR9372284.1 quinone-dependent dihydroorotate dehydrogenase [Conexibacter sp. JD483]
MLYRLLFTRLLSRLDAERAHHLGGRALRLIDTLPWLRVLVARLLAPRDPRLRTRALGLDLPSPLGVAAGFDKDGTTFGGLAALGFGFVEVGTVTAQGQPGNPRPRIFRLVQDAAMVNRMGFPNPGAAAVVPRLAARRPHEIVGINVGKTRVVADDQVEADYRASVRLLAPLADFLVLNVSSPNTPGLRDLQSTERLGALIAAVKDELAQHAIRLPLLVKIAPDLADEDIDSIADLALAQGLDGLIATNTTIGRDGLKTSRDEVDRIGFGGLSGAPLKQRSLEVLRRLHARAGGRLTLISVGGVESADDVWARIEAGATLVQGYTGFIYGGPLWASQLNRGLAKRARAAGLATVQDAVGRAAR